MKTGTTKTVVTSLPQEELAELDRVRRRQGLSRSEAVRDAIRWYVGATGWQSPPEELLPDDDRAIRRDKQQIAAYGRGTDRS
jgi:hypothetical protein